MWYPMRVIAGKYRGKRLSGPPGSRVRPTSDRVKETLFNILYSKGVFGGTAVLDLFAGTGALGIEALSRGAETAVFVDIDAESCRYVRENLRNVGECREVYHADYQTAVPKLSGREFDLILLDPPYAPAKEAAIADLILRHGILAENGMIVVEHARENTLSGLSEAFTRDTRVCRNTCLTFLTVGRKYE